MVAWFPPTFQARKLAIQKGEPVDDIHLTICHLGSVDTLPKNSIDILPWVVERVAARSHPLTGVIGGVGWFPAQDDRKGVIYASVDVPELDLLRADLVTALRKAGVHVSHEHGFQPHITLMYRRERDPLPEVPQLELELGELTLAIADERHVFKLSGEVDLHLPGKHDQKSHGRGGAITSDNVRSRADLEKLATIEPDELTHAVRTGDQIDSILEKGILPHSGHVSSSRGFVRNRGGGYVVFKADGGREYDDRVEPGLTYKEVRFDRVIPPTSITKVVRMVTTSTGSRFSEAELAQAVLDKRVSQDEARSLPPKYQAWLNFPTT